MSKITEALRAALDGREFYELMQAYRHAPIVPLHEAADGFEAVKARIIELVESAERGPANEQKERSS